jgi:Sulfotransferase family
MDKKKRSSSLLLVFMLVLVMMLSSQLAGPYLETKRLMKKFVQLHQTSVKNTTRIDFYSINLTDRNHPGRVAAESGWSLMLPTECPVDVFGPIHDGFNPSGGDNHNIGNRQPVRLEFIHIRKTGGTAIERAFERAGIAYANNYVRPNINYRSAMKRPTGSKRHIATRYYVNATSMPAQQRIKFFAVLRNPYDRAVSEFYQHFKNVNNQPANISISTNATFMNDFILEHFATPRLDLFIPQEEYIFDANGTRIVDHVLHFENLHREFAALMDCYRDVLVHNSSKNQTVVLPDKVINPRQKDASLTSQDLSKKSIAMINRVERKTFEEFGYEMIHAAQP